MRIVRYQRRSAIGIVQRMGIMLNETLIIDPNFVMQAHYEKEGYYQPQDRARRHVPSSLHEFLQICDHPIPSLQQIVGLYLKLSKEGILKTLNDSPLSFDLQDDPTSQLTCPIDFITSYRDFFTHEKHVSKGFEKRNEPIPPAWYEMPVYYKGSTTGFIGSGDLIPWPSYSDELDYELELACIIGRDGKNITAQNAYQHIFGFSILNDISARDIQRKEMSTRLGPSKGKDFCSILGPVIVTIDEFDFKDPDLLMTASVNGNEWSRGRSSEAHYSWGEMIEHLTKDEWMRAGDLLGSGTVGTGCGLELGRILKAGDLVELEIERIGRLKNIVGTKGV